MDFQRVEIENKELKARVLHMKDVVSALEKENLFLRKSANKDTS